MKSVTPLTALLQSFMLFCFTLGSASTGLCDEPVSLSGSVDLRGPISQEHDSVQEDPSLLGKMKIDAVNSGWGFHSWLEGGWDGTVKRPPRDHSLFKNFDEVYQSNSPYLEIKELYVMHSSGNLDVRAGIQRFAWGRLDEFPPNDLLNPWDYTQFIRKPLEDRKIGVPSLSAALTKAEWTYEAVWIPLLVPYRLPLPDERWSGFPFISSIAQTLPNSSIVPEEPNLPARTVEDGNEGVRIKRNGDIELALNLYHGYNPQPVFKTTALAIIPQGGTLVIDPGYVPDFHKIDVIGMDAATVRGELSIRAEAAYTFNRYLDIQHAFWGYPSSLAPGIYPLNPIEEKHDTADYGIGLDYRLFEDAMLTLQAQQTIFFGNIDLLYERRVETLAWINVQVSWMNQKIVTNLNVAYNPEHGDSMARVNGWYILSDSWKAGVTAMTLDGPVQSLFGRYARNDQVEADLIYSW